MKTALKLIAVLSISFTASCSDARMSAFSALGKKHRIKMYSGGAVVGEWVSSGKIENEKNSDGYYFKDDNTGKMVTVSGDVTITVD